VKNATLARIIDGYTAATDDEARDVARVRALARQVDDPWARALSLHVTGSAVVVHPPSRRVLLRWHARMQSWLQVGGHGDPGEDDPFVVALREAEEETGLNDLSAWPHPDARSIVQVAVVPVPAGKGEPAHEHADVRYALATASPEAIQPENADALLQWLEIPRALDAVGEDNLRVCLSRISHMMT
jgi:8-oxo-dGTP pyrophosphatase MutT (NUDIX family)